MKYSYTALLPVCVLALLLSPSLLEGQILYTDIAPDTVIAARAIGNPGEYSLDLNRDGRDDLIFSHSQGQFGLLSGVAWNTAGDVQSVMLVEWGTTAAALDFGAVIGPSSTGTWKNTNAIQNSILFTMNDLTGLEWDGAMDHYLGVAVQTQGGLCYGWVRLDIPEHIPNMKIKDCAVQTTPGTPITAGDNGVSSVDPHSILSEDIQVYSTGSTLYVSFPAQPQPGVSVLLVDMLGKTIAEYEANATRMTIGLQSLPRGAYGVIVHSGSVARATVIARW